MNTVFCSTVPWPSVRSRRMSWPSWVEWVFFSIQFMTHSLGRRIGGALGPEVSTTRMSPLGST